MEKSIAVSLRADIWMDRLRRRRRVRKCVVICCIFARLGNDDAEREERLIVEAMIGKGVIPSSELMDGVR